MTDLPEAMVEGVVMEFIEALNNPRDLEETARAALEAAGVGELLEAAKALLARDERKTCRHEETYRGGAIWEICRFCGAKWADDEGGKPEWRNPPEWIALRAAIANAEGRADG